MSDTKRSSRLIVLVACAVVALGVAYYYREYKFARPVGTGPAGPAVPKQAFGETWTERPVHVVGLGDSVTAGLGAARPSHSYFNRVLTNPQGEFAAMKGLCLTSVLPNLTWENLAISGSESQVHHDVVTERLSTHPDDTFGIILMTSGGNDLIHMYGKSPPRECAMYGATLSEAKPWIAKFETRLRSIFDTIVSRFPGGCEIYIGDIYDPTDGQGDAPSIFLPEWPDGLAIHANYNAVIRRVCNDYPNAFVVPLYDTFLGHGAHCRQWWLESYCAEDPHYWFYSNVEDPNDRGYDAIRRVYLTAIANNTSLRTPASDRQDVALGSGGVAVEAERQSGDFFNDRSKEESAGLPKQGSTFVN